MGEREEFLEILAQNLSNESKWFLWALMKEKDALHKEKLKDIANMGYREMLKSEGKDATGAALVSSRHGLDIHTARLEGAGLVKVQEIGRIRMYSLTKLGEDLLRYAASKKQL